jgi:hypothetical protein
MASAITNGAITSTAIIAHTTGATAITRDTMAIMAADRTGITAAAVRT